MSKNQCPETPAVGAELLALVTVSLSAIQLHLTNADPKISLRAVAELTKLLNICARHGISIENGTPVASSPVAATPTAVPPAAPTPAPASVSDAVVSRVSQIVANLAAEMGQEFDDAFEDVFEDDDSEEDDAEELTEENTSPMIVPTFTREPDIVLPSKAPRNPLRSPILSTVPDVRTVPTGRPAVPLLSAPIRLTDCLKGPNLPLPGRSPTDSR